MTRSNKFGLSLALLLAILVVLALLGPRPKVDPFTLGHVAFPENLDNYLEQQEKRYDDLRPGLAKGIVWASPAKKAKTPLSIVYLHGFSASRGEMSPVVENVAMSLKANLFFTRFRGHGQTPEALGKSKVRDWFEDVNEAVNIGERIGDRVVLIGMSTGGTLALWAALQRPTLAALVLLSPNFGPKDPKSGILLWPWGLQLAKMLVGPERAWEPKNELEARIWTCRYPLEATLPMMAVVEHVNNLDLSKLHVPTLVLYTDHDQTVDTTLIKSKFESFGSGEKKLIRFDEAKQHVLAGDAVSPETSAKAEGFLRDFVRPLGMRN